VGSLEDHKGFGALHPQFWRARATTVPRSSCRPRCADRGHIVERKILVHVVRTRTVIVRYVVRYIVRVTPAIETVLLTVYSPRV